MKNESSEPKVMWDALYFVEFSLLDIYRTGHYDKNGEKVYDK